MSDNRTLQEKIHDDLHIVVKDVVCPYCGSPEVDPATTHLPWHQRKLLIRGFKVGDENGWWSECLVCKETDGNGWWCETEDGRFIIEPARVEALKKRGFTVAE